MRHLRNVAVIVGGVWAGEMLSGMAISALPASITGGAITPGKEKIVRYALTGVVVLFALKALGSRGKKG